MPLRFEPNVSAADWFARSEDSWIQLCCIGPSGFASYGRIFHPLQPGHNEDNPEDLASIEGDLAAGTLEWLVHVLTRHTGTPNDCFFGLWDGFGDIQGSPSVTFMTSGSAHDRHRSTTVGPAIPSAFSPEVMSGPRVKIPHREYLLFRGPISEAGQWGAVDLAPGHPRPINSPNLMWPADHAWFAATEIDQPWTGIGGPAALLDDVLADPSLDAQIVENPAQIPYWRN